MIIGTLKIQIHLQGIDSLKQKRGIIKSLIERMKNKYNVSVSEVDSQDNRRLAQIGIAIVSNDANFMNSQLDTIIQFVTSDPRYYVGTIDREIFYSGNDS